MLMAELQLIVVYPGQEHGSCTPHLSGWGRVGGGVGGGGHTKT